ncbi:hypothetical protein [Tardiphaga sp.]|uniref:hypothetical protein n=1 Tax=Tardiphaga sp. TaxID=1926292 RepID=UPI0025EC7376|nr:hypothetical protein [Tardiphaga sp.]
MRASGNPDAPIEPPFDEITRIGGYVCQNLVSIISLVDEGRQWFKSAVGTPLRQTPLEQPIRARGILEHNYLEVEDTTRDSGLDCDPLITGDPKISFYTGALSPTPNDLPLGTICMLDDKPRVLSPEQRNVLPDHRRLQIDRGELATKRRGEAHRSDRDTEQREGG